MKMKTMFLVIGLLLIPVTAAYSIDFSVGPTFQQLEISGKVKSDGTVLSLTSDLGLDDDEPTGFSARLDMWRFHLALDYTSVEFSGDKTLTQPFTFENQVYIITANTSSKLAYDLTEITGYFDVINAGPETIGAISIAPMVKLSIYDAEVEIKKTNAPTLEESYSETLPVPTVGLVFHMNVTSIVEASAQASGIGYDDDTFTEYKISASVRPIKHLRIEAGYKETQIDFDDDDQMLDFETSGYYGTAAFVLSF